MADSDLDGLTQATDIVNAKFYGVQGGLDKSFAASLFPTAVTPINPAQFSAAVANSASQLITTGSVQQVTNMSTVDWDPSGFWNTSTQRMTPTRAGLYSVDGKVTISSLDDGKLLVVFLIKNGSIYGLLGRGTAGATARAGFGGSLCVPMNGTTDYLELHVIHNNAVDTNIEGNPGSEPRYTTLSATYIGPAP